MDQQRSPSQSSVTLDPAPKSPTDPKAQGKNPVVRGARACTVCRAAKMKCVGADDGEPCQRCKRSGSECIFEKHRRGRKPGSKLSEASKMLRRLEKGLNTAKLKHQMTSEPSISLPYPPDTRPADLFPNNELRPLQIPQDRDGPFPPLAASNQLKHEDEDEDNEKTDKGMVPLKLIQKERNSFLKTILNPEPAEPSASKAASERSGTVDTQRHPTPPTAVRSIPPVAPVLRVPDLDDPITAGLIDEAHANVLFDLFFLRLNPFINLFDPALHTVGYVRARCPFLFTAIIMACCKFFDVTHYKKVQQLAHEFSVRAFAENWKRVEVCQAFACLIYWREPEDQRTWTYIGYACRMAVELDLNRYIGKRTAEENELQFRERRNRERTYLVLFVHDRSLSTQTGRQWMLPECELIRHSTTWHEDAGLPIRPEDVIVAAFVQLRRIASETTEVFYSHRGAGGSTHADVNHDVLLRNCNGKLTQWAETWQSEMQKANGEKFHFAFLSLFRLYVRLYLNSFGIQSSMSSASRTSPSLQALSACYTSALETLQIVTKEFAAMGVLRYSQDSITVMTAYAAVFLLKLLRSSNTLAELHEGATDEIYNHISQAAQAYEDASIGAPSSSTSAAHHARFLKCLVANDIFRAKERLQQARTADARTQAPYTAYGPSSSTSQSPPLVHSQHMMQQSQNHFEQNHFHFTTSPTVSAPPISVPGPSYPSHSSSHGHSSIRDSDYHSNSAPDVPIRHGSAGSYSSYSGAPHSPPQSMQHPSPTQNQTAQLYSAAFPTSESDVTYMKDMWRQLGYGEQMDGVYAPISGYASTMPEGGSLGWLGMTTNAGYHETGVGAQSSHSNHTSRYQPYPPPTYNSHVSYSGLAGR